MSTRHILFVIGIWALTPAATASAAVALLDETTVRVYDSAGLDAAVKHAAFAVAAQTLAAASVAVRWEHCDPSARMCRTPLAAGELVVRIVRSPAPRWSPAGAVAHEMGHLLLATSVHAASGLMRPIWSREDLRKARDADWSFTREEIAAIRRRY